MRFATHAVLFSLACILCGCATPNVPQQHVLMANSMGAAVDLADGKSELDKPDDYSYSLTREHIATIIKGIQNHPQVNGRKRVLIYIHGGLNNRHSSLKNARRVLEGLLRKDPNKSCPTSNCYYPIIINWRSGLTDSYFEHLFLLRRGVHQTYWESIASPFILATDITRGIGRMPQNYLELVLESAGYNSTNWGIHPNVCYLAKNRIMEEKLPAIELGRDYRPKVEDFASSVGGTWLQVPRSLVGSILLDPFGTSAWNNMLRRTQTLFDCVPESPEFEWPRGQRRVGALEILFEELLTLSEKEKNWEVTLIGHSMGTIVIHEIVSRFPRLPYDNIVFMAGASSINDFRKSIVPYMQLVNRSAKFYNITLHPSAERNEMHWSHIPPRGSLLVWIDAMFSDPKTPFDRTIGRWDNILSLLLATPEAISDRISIKSFPFCGGFGDKKFCRGFPRRHGEFDDHEFWLEEYWRATPPKTIDELEKIYGCRFDTQ